MEKNILVHSFIPEDLKDRMLGIVDEKNIPNMQKTGFYRYYGIYLDGVQIGETLYTIEFGKAIFSLDKIEIDSKYRDCGYGSILLDESIRDLIGDIDYLQRVNVCSLPGAIKFYLNNGFEPYFGDNNLTKKVRNIMKKQSDNMSKNKTVINDEEITTQWYQSNALRTLNDFGTRDKLKLNAYIGIIGEYGEFFDYVKKLYTHNLNSEKQEEVCNLAPKELGDVVWYLATSLATYFDYSMDDIYDQITGGIDKDDSGYDIDIIYEYINNDFDKNNIFREMMNFKITLNKLDTAESREEVIKVVAEILKEIARILNGLFGRKLSEILYLNIDKLRKRYPEGFSTVVSNYRIDTQKKYKEEDSMKVLKKNLGQDEQSY